MFALKAAGRDVIDICRTKGRLRSLAETRAINMLIRRFVHHAP